MFGLIKTGIRLAAHVMIYTTAITYMFDWFPAVANFFVVSGVPPLILTVITCTMSTLNWIFSPIIINIALVIWLFMPLVKLGFYFAHKIATI